MMLLGAEETIPVHKGKQPLYFRIPITSLLSNSRPFLMNRFGIFGYCYFRQTQFSSVRHGILVQMSPFVCVLYSRDLNIAGHVKNLTAFELMKYSNYCY